METKELMALMVMVNAAMQAGAIRARHDCDADAGPPILARALWCVKEAGEDASMAADKPAALADAYAANARRNADATEGYLRAAQILGLDDAPFVRAMEEARKAAREAEHWAAKAKLPTDADARCRLETWEGGRSHGLPRWIKVSEGYLHELQTYASEADARLSPWRIIRPDLMQVLAEGH